MNIQCGSTNEAQMEAQNISSYFGITHLDMNNFS